MDKQQLYNRKVAEVAARLAEMAQEAAELRQLGIANLVDEQVANEVRAALAKVLGDQT